ATGSRPSMAGCWSARSPAPSSASRSARRTVTCSTHATRRSCARWCTAWSASAPRPARPWQSPQRRSDMVISGQLHCIFVHVQKTGGSSIEAALRRYDTNIPEKPFNARRHLGARDIRQLVPADAWSASLKFAFVRNPWDRLVSWYYMCVQAPMPNAFGRYVKEHAKSFDDFVMRPHGMMERTTVPQMDYIADTDGRVIVDFVGRYETLQADFAEV